MKVNLDMNLFRFKKRVKKKKTAVIIQENPEECIKIIETNFPKNIFKESVTDISYNGQNFYAQDNDIGRHKLDIKMSSDEVLTFIRKIANYMLQPFSITNPSLDVSFGDYRLNAIHPSLARTNNHKVVTFSLRKITATLKIKENDTTLAPYMVHIFLKALMRSYQSVLISGQTGSGKTEFQKYLISLMNNQDRIILIEESYETHIKEIYKDMDITSWIVNNSRDEMSSLVRLSLRNNPDWVIIAETRGLEAYDMIQAVMTGHSAITTIHSESAKYSIDRISSMCKKNIDFDEQMMLSNIAKHIKVGIHLEKKFDQNKGKFIRRISEIVEYIPTENGYDINTLFKIEKNENLQERYIYNCISKNLKEVFIKNDIPLRTLDRFVREGKKYENKKTQ